MLKDPSSFHLCPLGGLSVHQAGLAPAGFARSVWRQRPAGLGNPESVLSSCCGNFPALLQVVSVPNGPGNAELSARPQPEDTAV